MAELNSRELGSRDKLVLAHFYETEDFKAFTRLCEIKRLKLAEQVLGTDMSTPGSTEKVSMLQGQYGALDFLLMEIRKIHKDTHKD